MRVTKFGHSCFIVEPKDGVRVLTDPGAFSPRAVEAENISAIVITHEHQDHTHADTLKKVLAKNPNAVILTNTAVGEILDEAGIKYTKLEEGQRYDLQGINIQAFGNVHAEIYPTITLCQNTGYLIDTLYHPGDALYYPDAHIDILALPIAAPWMKTKDAVDYVKNMNSRPRVVFAVHDAHIQDWAEFMWRVPGKLLEETGIPFKRLELGKEYDL